MQEYEDGVKVTKISDIDNNSCSPNIDSMEILTNMKPVASFATRFQLDRRWVPSWRSKPAKPKSSYFQYFNISIPATNSSTLQIKIRTFAV